MQKKVTFGYHQNGGAPTARDVHEACLSAAVQAVGIPLSDVQWASACSAFSSEFARLERINARPSRPPADRE